MRITEKQMAKWFPKDRRFLHFCAKYYGYTFHNDEVVEHANFYAIRNITKMFNEGREFEDEKHMTGIVMSSFRFAILSGYNAYAKTKRLGDRPMTDYEYDDGFNSVMDTAQSNDKPYDNTMILIKAVMQELPPIQAELIQRHYLDQETLQSVSRDLGIDYTTARRHMRNALRKIRKVLENEEPRETKHTNKPADNPKTIGSLPKPVRSKPVATNKAEDSSHSEAMSFLYS